VSASAELMVDGIPICYQVDGVEQGPWLVFSNSLVTSLSLWDKQVEALKHQFRILRYDQRGHGASGIPTEAPSFNILARDVIALLDHLEIETCTYIGVSMGVPTGLALWQQASSRMARLVLVDGQAKTNALGAKVWQERKDFANEHGMTAFAEITIARWFMESTIAAGGAQQVLEGICATPLAGFMALASALQSFDFSAVLETITVPTLLLVGEHDGPLPEVMEQMHHNIAGSIYRVIAGTGHLPNWERPDEFNSYVSDFLNDHIDCNS
jgi:3-oxoadipate enol-lactonase